MRIAFCFVGQMRTALEVSKNIKNYIGDLITSCDFFIHTWDINTPAPGIETDVLDMHIINQELKTKIDPQILNLYNQEYSPVSMIVDDFSKYFRLGDISMPFYYSVNRVLSEKNLYERSMNIKYDYVVISRPDLSFDSTKRFIDDLSLISGRNDFAFLDMFEDGNYQIDSTLWIFPNNLTRGPLNFDNYRIRYKFTEDDQILLRRWLGERYKYNLVPITNKNVRIYRQVHLKNKIVPGSNKIIDLLNSYIDGKK